MVQRARGTKTATAGRGEAKEMAAHPAREAGGSHKQMRRSQAQVSEAIGVARTRYGEMERGDGAHAPLELWVKLGFALGRPLAVSFSRDISTDGSAADPRDAGHLGA